MSLFIVTLFVVVVTGTAIRDNCSPNGCRCCIMKSGLVHGVFNSVEDVYKATTDRLAKKGFTIDQFTWVGSENCPFEYIDDSDVVIALDVTLGCLQSTFKFAYDWAADGQQGLSTLYGHFRSDSEKLRLLQGSAAFKPMSLRWRRIKLFESTERMPRYARSPERSPGIVIMLAVAQHPALVHRPRVGWYMSGLESFNADTVEPWSGVPIIRLNQDGHGLMMVAASWYEATGLWTAIFRE